MTHGVPALHAFDFRSRRSVELEHELPDSVAVSKVVVPSSFSPGDDRSIVCDRSCRNRCFTLAPLKGDTTFDLDCTVEFRVRVNLVHGTAHLGRDKTIDVDYC